MMKSNINLPILLTVLACLVQSPWIVLAADPPPAIKFRAALFHDNFVTGTLADCDQRSMLAMRSPDFADPLVFPVQPLSQLTRVDAVPRREGDALRFLLTDRSSLMGELTELTSDSVTINSTMFGHVQLHRNQVSQIVRRLHDDVQLVGSDPSNGTNSGSTDNTDEATQPASLWKQTMGPLQLPAEKLLLREPSTFITTDGVIPVQSEIRLALSWLDSPDFAIALVDGEDNPRAAVSLETWKDKLMLVVESADAAQSHVIIDSLTSNQSLELVVCIDQLHKNLTIYAPSGRQLTSIALIGDLPLQSARLRLSNYATDDARFGLRLENLVVRRWSSRTVVGKSEPGQAEKPNDTDAPNNISAATGDRDFATFSNTEQPANPGLDGSIMEGQLQNYDAASGQLVFVTNGKTHRMPLALLERLSFGNEHKRVSDDVLTPLNEPLPVPRAVTTNTNSARPTAANQAAVQTTDDDKTNIDKSKTGEASAHAKDTPPREPELHLSAQLIDGSRILGQLVRIQADRIVMELLGSGVPVTFAVSDLSSLQVMASSSDIETWAKTRAAQFGHLESTLSTSSTRLLGSLVESEGDGQLVWQSLFTANASAFAPSAQGMIELQSHPMSAAALEPRKSNPVAQQRAVNRAAGGRAAIAANDVRLPAAFAPALDDQRARIADLMRQAQADMLANQQLIDKMESAIRKEVENTAQELARAQADPQAQPAEAIQTLTANKARLEEQIKKIRDAKAVQQAQVPAQLQALAQVQAKLQAQAQLQAQAGVVQPPVLNVPVPIGRAEQPIRVQGMVIPNGVQIFNGQQAVVINGQQAFIVRDGLRAPSSSIPRERLGEPGLAFRSGDQIAGTVTKIDEHGVTFQSTATTTTFAAHDKWDSVVLLFKWNEQRIAPEKLKRLLTVPRSMKADPPTHLVMSFSGDYLRGRLQSLDEHELVMEVGSEQVRVKRDEVAKIYWLYQRDWTNDPAFESPETPKRIDQPAPLGQLPPSDSSGSPSSTGTPSTEGTPNSSDSMVTTALKVHVLDRAGRALVFVPRKLSGQTLSGTSPILNSCSVELSQISHIYFSQNIEELVASRRPETWKLSVARTPRAFEESEDDKEVGRSSGNASPLVGQPAPPVDLLNLNGQPWSLSDHRGRIVVLDFWASWCGPCMQAMPEVERIVSDVGQGKVDLVAVNLQESKDKAAAALERLKITPTVLLDTEGLVARDYQARAIPQTVIIDASGAITHLFVGGGKRTLAQLEAALKSMVEAKGEAQQ